MCCGGWWRRRGRAAPIRDAGWAIGLEFFLASRLEERVGGHTYRRLGPHVAPLIYLRGRMTRRLYR